MLKQKRIRSEKRGVVFKDYRLKKIDGKKIIGITTQMADEISCDIDSIIIPTLIFLSNYKRYQIKYRTEYSLDNAH